MSTPVISRGDIRAVSDFYQAGGQINGVKSEFNRIRYVPLNEGRWINDMDEQQNRRVIVLGDETRRVLFLGRQK